MISVGSNPFFSAVETSFSDCPLASRSKAFEPQNIDKTALDKPMAKEPAAVENFPKDVSEIKKPIQNKIDGLEREAVVKAELEEKYPAKDGCEIVSEAYLRDSKGSIIRDPKTGEARRVDFVVVKDGQAIDSIEVTSKTADKTEQLAKENRIREAGGNYIRVRDGNLVEIPSSVSTRVERKD